MAQEAQSDRSALSPWTHFGFFCFSTLLGMLTANQTKGSQPGDSWSVSGDIFGCCNWCE